MHSPTEAMDGPHRAPRASGTTRMSRIDQLLPRSPVPPRQQQRRSSLSGEDLPREQQPGRRSLRSKLPTSHQRDGRRSASAEAKREQRTDPAAPISGDRSGKPGVATANSAAPEYNGMADCVAAAARLRAAATPSWNWCARRSIHGTPSPVLRPTPTGSHSRTSPRIGCPDAEAHEHPRPT